MARPSVPQFGDWESEDNVPYTVYFDKARKNKGGKTINPNDPRERANVFPQAQPEVKKVAPQQEVKRVAPKAPTRSRISEEDSGGEYTPFGSPNYRGGRGRVANQWSHQEYVVKSAGGGSARPSRPSSIASDYSVERSPLRPTQQTRLTGRRNGNASPAAYEVKRSYDSSHGTPSRLKPRTGDNSRDVAIPKFGDWDARDPQSADNYTYIFNKNGRVAKGADEDSIPSHSSHHTKNEEVEAKFSQRCCFAISWAKK